MRGLALPQSAAASSRRLGSFSAAGRLTKVGGALHIRTPSGETVPVVLTNESRDALAKAHVKRNRKAGR